MKFLLLAAVLQTLLMLVFSRLPWVAVVFMAAAVVVCSWYEWTRLSLFVGRLSTAERRWFWQVKGGSRKEFQFSGELTLWRWLIVINGRDLEGRRLRLVLARDSAHADDWRRLQVALRYSR
ncbi:hypothetical protein PVT68_00010 [Microbulbifer bruguierae]|uniref:Toxin CptA n=1 Tax=Microbulbifer bruguierae TaxID=3029061 RepID=A0ABY8NE84_9GAMM|nr:protein YgfX [Microbulbifer bruguierae]WGL16704.1 hypothetical protein PVT68_00010 [Microbulbifer bruguierae]